jgi:threonine dehydrogenase-like Zn-dependent dehydrogenase
MREYFLVSPKKIKCVLRDPPQLKNSDVLIRITDVGICGSDIHLFNGSYTAPHHYPLMFGHEWSGVVEKTGSGVTKVKQGDLVTGDCSRFCGHCQACETDKNICEGIEKFGITIDGASGECIVRDEKYIYPVTEDIDPSLICLCEPIAVAAHLIGKMKNAHGDLCNGRILVMGGGVIGMAAMMLLKHMDGYDHVDLYDLAKFRTEIAASSGARIPSPSELEPFDGESYATMYSRTKYSAIIETTGVPSVFSNAIKLLKPSGILGCAGMTSQVQIPQKLIVTKSLTIIGSIGGTGDFDKAISFIMNYPNEAKKLISHHFSVDDVSKAFETAMKPEEAMKVVLKI